MLHEAHDCARKARISKEGQVGARKRHGGAGEEQDKGAAGRGIGSDLHSQSVSCLADRKPGVEAKIDMADPDMDGSEDNVSNHNCG